MTTRFIYARPSMTQAESCCLSGCLPACPPACLSVALTPTHHASGPGRSRLRCVGRPPHRTGLVSALCARQLAGRRHARASSLPHGDRVTSGWRLSHNGLCSHHSGSGSQCTDPWSCQCESHGYRTPARRHGVWRGQHCCYTGRPRECPTHWVGAAADGFMAVGVWADRGALCGGKCPVGGVGWGYASA